MNLFRPRFLRYFFLLICLNQAALAQEAQPTPDNFEVPGGVPLSFERQAAPDLLFEGKPLKPDEARALARKWKAENVLDQNGKIRDLSTLNPKTDGLLWNDQFPSVQESDLAELELARDGESVEFLGNKPTTPGKVLFVVQKKFSDGRVKVYRILIDDKGHNILARRTLLRKIGYNVLPVSRLATVRVNFQHQTAKEDFVLNRIKNEIYQNGDRWVKEGLETKDNSITLQDVIVMGDAADWHLSFARGDMAPGLVNGQRFMQGLLLPFSMLDAPESLNVMDWDGAPIFNDQIVFQHGDASYFSPSLDDARWVGRRLLRLKVQDWAEIAKSADMPIEPQLLYEQKMLSRRNHYRRVLQLEDEFAELPVNYKITYGERLVEGKLVNGRTWQGYGRMFAGEDSVSPLNIKEVFALLRSKAESNVLSNVVSEFNNRYVPRTDLGFKVFDHQLDLAAQQFAQFLITKKASKVPVGVWSTPYYNGNVIVAREVIPGSYMGSENIIQKADTVGFAVERGRFFWGDGLPPGLSASARLKLQLVVTSTHLKPVQSIRESLKQPISDILVPLLKRKSLAPMKEMLALEERIKNKEFEDPNAERRKEKQKLLKDEFSRLFGDLAKSIGPGESYLLNISLSPGFDLAVGKSLSEDAQAYLRFQERLVGVYRVNLYRKDEKTVHLYINKAGFNELSAAVGAKFKIPILEFGHIWPAGKGFTDFYKFNIDSDLEKNPDFFKELRGFYAVVDGVSQKYLNKIKRPWELELDFSDSRQYFNFLVWKLAQTNTTNVIKATAPEGPEIELIRRYRGQRSGFDIENLTLNAANYLLEERYGDRYRLATKNSGNPADTVFGRSLTRDVVSEARALPGPLDMGNFYASVGYRWRGWEIKKSNVLKIFEEIEAMYGERVFERPDLNDTKEVQFYTVEVQAILYKSAFERLLKLTEEQVRDLFNRHGRYAAHQGEATVLPQDQIHPWATEIWRDLKKLKRAYAKNDSHEFTNRLVYIVDIAESQLTFAGFKELVGGLENIFVQGTLRGFRDGTEKGEQDLRGNTLGRIGGRDPRGPLMKFQMNTGITSGEMLLYWLVNPL